MPHTNITLIISIIWGFTMSWDERFLYFLWRFLFTFSLHKALGLILSVDSSDNPLLNTSFWCHPYRKSIIHTQEKKNVVFLCFISFYPTQHECRRNREETSNHRERKGGPSIQWLGRMPERVRVYCLLTIWIILDTYKCSYFSSFNMIAIHFDSVIFYFLLNSQ